MTQLLESVVVETGPQPEHSVIWLHGLGADGHDFEPIVPELGLPVGLAIRFVFPHAPIQPVTINNGMAMRSWYDIKSLSTEGRADEQGIRESQAKIVALIEAEKAHGIAAENIVIAGFSQGSALALHTALRHHERLAGIIALSGYLPLPNSLESELSLANRETPVFMAHGSQDPVVDPQFGRDSFERLKALNLNVQWHEYQMAHMVCMEEIQAIGQWLTARFSD